MTAQERLKLFISYKGISMRKFEMAACVPVGYVKNIKYTITPDKQEKISAAFPELNLGWLTSGEGEMLRHTPSQNAQAQKSTDSHSKPIVPKYLTSQPNTDVYKILNTDGHTMQLDSMTAIPPYNNFDFYYMVRQDAMKPLYKEGDVLALAHTERGSDIIQGASMIIDTNDFGFLLRRIYDRGDYYECRIINENSSFETQKIAKTKVIRLYRIVYSIRLGD